MLARPSREETMTAESLSIAVDAATRVSGLLQAPPGARAAYVLAHGAGAGMTHPSLAATADGLAKRGIATLRFQFPFMEAGTGRPDPPVRAQAAVRAAVAEAGRRLPGLALVAGGRSFGGRMTSQAQAASPLPGVAGLAFLAFPLHPAGRPSDQRAEHLAAVQVPMLFLQGTNDALAELALLRPLVARLGERAALHLLEGADHAFHVPKKSGRTDAEVRDEAVGVLAAWITKVGRE
jgi:predicted alpha/beta-hydrolase family hydrolase